jgi:hypothetical protein
MIKLTFIYLCRSLRSFLRFIDLANFRHDGFHQLFPWMKCKILIDCVTIEFDVIRLDSQRHHPFHALADSNKFLDFLLVLAEISHHLTILGFFGSNFFFYTFYWE